MVVYNVKNSGGGVRDPETISHQKTEMGDQCVPAYRGNEMVKAKEMPRRQSNTIAARLRN